MKRDMELVRALLMKVESYPSGYAPEKIQIGDYTEEQIKYHSFLLDEAGLVKAVDLTGMGSSIPEAQIIRLTWNGHEFLDSAREPSRWEQAKNQMNKVGGASIQVWMALLTALAKDKLGI